LPVKQHTQKAQASQPAFFLSSPPAAVSACDAATYNTQAKPNITSKPTTQSFLKNQSANQPL
jgi:hypothetical protein